MAEVGRSMDIRAGLEDMVMTKVLGRSDLQCTIGMAQRLAYRVLVGQSRVRKSASQFTKLAATNVASKVTRSPPCTG